MFNINGLKITFSEHAMADTTERLFPASRHRSKRIHKKLVKRFGGEFRKVPCIYKTPSGIVMHPSYRAELMKQSKGFSDYGSTGWGRGEIYGL
jgi:hypothetical protein